MPLKLRPPRPGKTPHYEIRGTYLGVKVEESTRSGRRQIAEQILRRKREEIERGAVARPGEPTFADAAINYMTAGGERRFMEPLIHHFGLATLSSIDQAAIDRAAAAILPVADAPTRNRQVYTPVSAVLKRAGIKWEVARPLGWRGRVVRKWMWPEQAWRVLDAVDEIDHELWVMCVMLLFGGLRISEQLAMTCDDVRLDEAFAFVPDSKNGEPQPMHLTAFMVEALKSHPRGLARPGERLFRFHKGGGLDFKLIQACAVTSGIEMPKRAGRGSKWPKLPPYEFDWVSWHTFRRTYATWMRRYAGLDDKDLLDTHRWNSIESAGRYAQTVIREAARKADLLPRPERRRA